MFSVEVGMVCIEKQEHLLTTWRFSFSFTQITFQHNLSVRSTCAMLKAGEYGMRYCTKYQNQLMVITQLVLMWMLCFSSAAHPGEDPRCCWPEGHRPLWRTNSAVPGGDETGGSQLYLTLIMTLSTQKNTSRLIPPPSPQRDMLQVGWALVSGTGFHLLFLMPYLH